MHGRLLQVLAQGRSGSACLAKPHETCHTAQPFCPPMGSAAGTGHHVLPLSKGSSSGTLGGETAQERHIIHGYIKLSTPHMFSSPDGARFAQLYCRTIDLQPPYLLVQHINNDDNNYTQQLT